LPLSLSFLPFLPNDSSADWSRALRSLSQNAKEQLRNTSTLVYPSVSFDSVQKSVSLFMPGFDKSEIKLYQVRRLISLSLYCICCVTIKILVVLIIQKSCFLDVKF
jgi:hypothetical protein